MVTVSFTETYDLSTKTNKMTLIGIHTPTKGIFQRLYPGFLMQYARCRILSQDVTIACASMLPADPLQVGVESGDIAPEDLFNPILYKAMTNDSWSTLEARVNGFVYKGETGLSAQGYSAEVSKEHTTAVADEFGIYYSLLSNRRGWRVANPQAGLSMTGLKPLVFDRWFTNGVNGPSAGDPRVITYGTQSGGANPDIRMATDAPGYMRGNAHPMPAFNTSYVTFVDLGGTFTGNGSTQTNPDGTSADADRPVNAQADMPELPKVMTACIVVPPSRLHKLYYRMAVTTHVEFFEPRSMDEVTSFAQNSSYLAPAVYFTDYSFSSKLLTNETSSVDVTEDATIEKIMESNK